MSLADELLADLEDPGEEEDLDLAGDEGDDAAMDEIEEITEDSALQVHLSLLYTCTVKSGTGKTSKKWH